jgi:hypothetical protein
LWSRRYRNLYRTQIDNQSYELNHFSPEDVYVHNKYSKRREMGKSIENPSQKTVGSPNKKQKNALSPPQPASQQNFLSLYHQSLSPVIKGKGRKEGIWPMGHNGMRRERCAYKKVPCAVRAQMDRGDWELIRRNKLGL